MPRLQTATDSVAILLSSLCAIHCLATPLLLVVLPSLGGVIALDDEAFHQLLLYFVIPVGLVALTIGFIHHGNRQVLTAGLFGLGLLACAALLGHDIISHSGETALTLLASAIIVLAHVRNFQLRRRHKAAAGSETV